MMENQALVEPAFRTGRCWLGRSVTNQLTAPKHPVSSQSQSFNASRNTYAYYAKSSAYLSRGVRSNFACSSLAIKPARTLRMQWG